VHPTLSNLPRLLALVLSRNSDAQRCSHQFRRIEHCSITLLLRYAKLLRLDLIRFSPACTKFTICHDFPQIFHDLGLGRLEKSNLHSRFLLASSGAISFQVLGATEQLTSKVDFFRRSTRRGHFHFGLVSVQLHLGIVRSGRKKRIDFASTLRVRGLPKKARGSPCTILRCITYSFEAFWTIPLLSYLWLAGLLLYHKLLSLERADWAESSAETHHGLGPELLRQNELHGDIDTLRLYYTGTYDTEA